MQQQPSENTDSTLEWFTENLPPEYLNHPEYFLYSTALEVQGMQDIPENRRRFKQLLIERQVGEGIDLPEVDQQQLDKFMRPNDKELRLKRAKELVKLVDIHLNEKHDFEKAQRQSLLELFHREAPFKQVEMDEAYFSNRELVEADLRAYLEHTRGDLLKDLTTGSPKWSAVTVAQNGERIAWNVYLKRASGVLLNTKKRTNNPHRPADALKTLLRIADSTILEYIPMDEEYFSNPKFVKADLTAYLQYAKGDSLKDLHTNNPKGSVSMLTQSGEQVRWQAYLHRASGVLFGTKHLSDNPPRSTDALKLLLRIIGVYIPEYIHMDEAYFNNPDFVKADLLAYLKIAKGDEFTDLTTGNPKNSVSVLTQSGEQVKWETYLKRASGVLFDTKSRGDNLHRPVEALKFFLRLIGIDVPEIMDEKYFNNYEIVKTDLTAYLKHAKGDLLRDLSTSNPKPSTSIQIQSGEQVKWRTYLYRASGVLLGTKQGNKQKKSDNPHRPADALKTLLRIADSTIPEYISMDEEYFSNPKFVKADLAAYLQRTKKKSIGGLSMRSPSPSVSIQTQSGEQVKWNTYLSRASGVLFGTKAGKKSSNPHRQTDALKALFKILEIAIPEYISMDEVYFNNPDYVRADLTNYLKYAKGYSFKDVNTCNPKPSTSIRAQNGEQVRWETYLDRASGAILGTKSRGNNRHRPTDALKKLIEIALQADACETRNPNPEIRKSKS